MLDALRDVLRAASVALPPPAFVQAHRWGSAFPVVVDASGGGGGGGGAPSCLRADGARLAACGDFCAGGGAEGAVLSGLAAADAVRAMFE